MVFGANGINFGNLRPTETGYYDYITGRIYSSQDVMRASASYMANAVHSSGYTVDPERLNSTDFTDFMGQAGKILDPYYAQKIKTLNESVSTKAGRIRSDLREKKEALIKAEDISTREGRTTLADRGLTFSGARGAFDVKQAEDLGNALSLAQGQANDAEKILFNTTDDNLGDYGRSRESETFNRAQSMSTNKNAQIAAGYNRNLNFGDSWKNYGNGNVNNTGMSWGDRERLYGYNQQLQRNSF